MASEWEQLVASGCAAVVVQCDTAEVSHVRRLMTIGRSQGEVVGLYHAAGVLADGVLARQSATTLARVYGPKSHGGWALHSMISCTALQACALFSSVATLLGGAGQANYSAANQCLDMLSAHRQSQGRHSVSVQWGAWAEIGMASRGPASERMATMEEAAGLKRITISQGLGALQAALLPQAPAVLAMLPVQWHRMLGEGIGAVPSLLSEMAPARTSVQAVSTEAPVSKSVVTLEAVLEVVKRTAGNNEIDADAPLMEAGIDSLGAVELRNVLQRAAGEGVVLSSTLMFDYPTARQVALHLRGTESPIARPVGDNADAALAQSVGEVEVAGLSVVLPANLVDTESELCNLYRATACSMDLLCEIPLARWDAPRFDEMLVDSPPEVRSRGGTAGS